MTLTSQLRDSSSPLAKLFAATLPDVDAVLDSFRDKVSPAPLPVRPRAPAGAVVPWATAGTAVDLRLRWALTGAPSEDRAVEHGLARAVDVLEWDPPAGCDVPAGELFAAAGREVLRRVEDLFERVSPWDRTRPVRLSAPEEDLLDRAAFVLAEFAELYRARRVGLVLGGVYEGRGAVTADGLLAAVPGYMAADLAAMAGRADVGLAALRSGTTPAEVTAGPQFAGSDAAGNADGDWVAGGLLVDVKATLHPERLGAARRRRSPATRSSIPRCLRSRRWPSRPPPAARSLTGTDRFGNSEP